MLPSLVYPYSELDIEQDEGCEKVEKSFQFCDLFILKRQCIYSILKGCKVLNKVCERGTISQQKVYERSNEAFLSKKVYKRVRDWTLGRSPPDKTWLSTLGRVIK